jgi:putative transcriptional regulator
MKEAKSPKSNPGGERETRQRTRRESKTLMGSAKGTRQRGYLDGQMLIAMPSMRDERFARTLIYICAHSSEGAMGIVVNQPASNVKLPDLLVQLDVISDADRIQLPPSAGAVPVLKGGPVEPGRGFVLHSSDFFIENSTWPIDDGICLTATLDVLKAIAKGDGPGSALLALGYAGWAAGQLETEIQGNGWLHCSADPDLLFGLDVDQKYERALKKLGIHVGMLSSEAGHA